MAPQERKRGYSQAFDSASDSIDIPIHYAAHDIPRAIAAPALYGLKTPPTFFDSDKENITPFCQGKGEANELAGAPQAMYSGGQDHSLLHLQSYPRLQLHGYPLQDYSEQQFIRKDITYQAMLQPTQIQYRTQDSSELGSSPPRFSSDFASSYSPDVALEASLDSEPGPTIYEDPDTTIHDQCVPMDPLTPSDLNMQGLTLLDIPNQPISLYPRQPVIQYNRASVYIMRTEIFNELRSPLCMYHKTEF